MDLIIKSEFARRVGITPQAVSKLVKASLAPAIVGGKIDLDHQAVRDYAKTHRKNLEGPPCVPNVGGRPPRDRKAELAAPVPAAISLSDESVETFGSMTLDQLVQRFGSDERFLKWLNARKTVADIMEKDLKHAIAKGKLISRDLVQRTLLDPLDTAFIRLVTDGARAASTKAITLTKAGRPIEEVEKAVAAEITPFVASLKGKLQKSLNHA